MWWIPPHHSFITELQTWKWVTAYPSTRPTWRENNAKYTVEKYLPSFLHTIETEYLSQPNTLPKVNDNQQQAEEVTTLYSARENQQQSAMPEDNEVPESGSYGAETVPHIESVEEEPTGVSDDEESELGYCYEIPTGEEESVEVESLSSTEVVHFISVSTPTSNPSSLSRSFAASVRAKYNQFSAFMRRLKSHL